MFRSAVWLCWTVQVLSSDRDCLLSMWEWRLRIFSTIKSAEVLKPSREFFLVLVFVFASSWGFSTVDTRRSCCRCLVVCVVQEPSELIQTQGWPLTGKARFGMKGSLVPGSSRSNRNSYVMRHVKLLKCSNWRSNRSKQCTISSYWTVKVTAN